MPDYDRPPLRTLESGPHRIASFTSEADSNLDARTVSAFGEEWTKFGEFTDAELREAGEQYFDVVTPEMLPPGCVALDVGCGSGRWSRFLSPRVAGIEAIDPGEAVHAAARFTAPCGNVRVTQAGVGAIPFADGAFGFVFSLGVLHHVPDTAAAVSQAVRKLRPGGWFLLYLYYALETRGAAYRALFGASNAVRRVISGLPTAPKQAVCDALAVLVYAPLVGIASGAKALSGGGGGWRSLPLAYYVGKSFHILRNDALDRFGTPLEQRFTRAEVEGMMRAAGLEDIRFSESSPFWHAVGRRTGG